MTDMPVPRSAELRRVAEWPTLLMLGITYGVWGVATVWISDISVLLAILLCAWNPAKKASETVSVTTKSHKRFCLHQS